MAVTNLPRSGLPQWSADGDEAETRTQANTRNQWLDDNAVLFLRGTFAARPAFGTVGRVYEVTTGTNAGRLYWDTGSSWLEIGSGSAGGGGWSSTFRMMGA